MKNKIIKISLSIFTISLLLIGSLQFLDSLYGSGLMMIFAGLIILIMKKELNLGAVR